MSLLLSSANITRLNDASRTLLSPFAFENGIAWREAACRAIAPLVNASCAYSGMTVEGEEFWTGDDDVVKSLSGTPIPDFAYRGAVERRIALRLDVADWTELYDVKEARASGFYEEVVRPLKLFAPLMILTELPGLPTSAFWQPPSDAGRQCGLMSLFFSFPDEKEALRSLQRNRAVLELLVPSFASGVRAYMHARHYRATFTQLIDRICVPLGVVNVSGGFIYRNRALSDLLQKDPEHQKICDAVQYAAGVVRVSMLRTRVKAAREYVVDYRGTEVRTSLGRYSIYVSFVEGGLHGLTDSVLVFIERSAPAQNSYSALASRYGLTPRETEVLQLLCAGLRTRQLAAQLQITVNTARRHVEHVLAKFGVHSRAALFVKLRD